MCLISPGEKKQEELHHTNAFRSPTTPKNNKLLNYDYTQYISVPPFPLSLLRASTWGIPTIQLYENRDGDPASVLLPLFLWLQTILAPHHLDWTERSWAPCLFSANSSLNLWCMMWNPPFFRMPERRSSSQLATKPTATELRTFSSKRKSLGFLWIHALQPGAMASIWGCSWSFTVFSDRTTFLAVAVVHS